MLQVLALSIHRHVQPPMPYAGRIAIIQGYVCVCRKAGKQGEVFLGGADVQDGCQMGAVKIAAEGV